MAIQRDRGPRPARGFRRSGGLLADAVVGHSGRRPDGLERIDCPVVLAQGTLDLVAVGQTPRYLAAVPAARFVPLYGAGHAPQSDTPGVILRLVHECTAAATERAAGRAPTLTALRPPA